MWIDSERPSASEKIVVCKPLLEREGAAVAVLNSHKREGAPSAIISGEGERLRHFIGELDSVDDRLDHFSDDELVAAIIKMAEMAKLSPIDFGEDPVEALAWVVLAIRRIPKPKAYPRFITKRGRKIWDGVVVDHKDVINRFKKDKKKMWAAAILMYQRACGTLGIEPFTKEDPGQDKVRKMAVNDINRKSNKGNFKAIQIIQNLFDDLKDEKLASKLTVEKFYEAARHRNIYYVTTFQRILLRRGVQPEAIIGKLLSRSGFYGKPGQYAAQGMNAVTDLIIEPEGAQVHCYITTHLSKDQIIILFGLAEEVTHKQILKALGTAGRKWVKTGLLIEVTR